MYNYKKYQNAKRKAKALGLIEAEYGDIYGTNPLKSYCYWNKTGNRHDKPIVYCEYYCDKNAGQPATDE